MYRLRAFRRLRPQPRTTRRRRSSWWTRSPVCASGSRILRPSKSERKAIAKELKGTRQRLQYLLAVSPAIIYTTKASGDFGCTFVSENLRAIMGYSPQEMTTDPKCWPDHLHPGRRSAGVRRDASPDRARRRHRRVSLPPSRRPLHLDPGHLQGRQRRRRPSARAGRRLGRHHREQGRRAGTLSRPTPSCKRPSAT